MLQSVLRIFEFWNFYDICGVWKYAVFPLKIKIVHLYKKYIVWFSQNFAFLALNFVNGFENLDLIQFLDLIKIAKMCLRNKMVIFTKVIVSFVSNFVFCFVDPLEIWCQCRNTGYWDDYIFKYKLLLTCAAEALARTASHRRASTHATFTWVKLKDVLRRL